MLLSTEDLQGDCLDVITLTSPSKSSYVGVARLTVSAIACRMGFDIEQIEDIKVAVAEACTNVIKHSHSIDFEIKFKIYKDKLEINVTDKGKGYNILSVKDTNIEEMKESGLGIFIIQTLMDEVYIDSKIGDGTSVKMIKYLGVDF
ncbi:serine/threonine-protein kinase RsbW [Alkalithermobacter thermoalcaliphilus JW-YL-7 = DSM 7308]|uniref:Putative anti-sigma regulatory factor, serine/threonine protein kinase n=1 Tax=Alkalithermobacter thermoalcaliphilus JW-YL-7 = DSM 7308 TaxID=1121328 RepID=A0A150FT16_CLOPD|nr:putative anti-sigma regulatory factor, serine/threonine protein kinase [[Clostridium] paradoxum JW-YL-7 = DSM 7308]SHL08157.1 serine/threonine-protein kinase RsbW [[Clostridium] paradoxum JW-YL-7 = DSM 7308]